MVRALAVTLLLLATASLPSGLPAQQTSPLSSAPQADWQAALSARRQQLIDSNGPGTNAGLRSELLSLRDQDQAARGLHGAEPAAKGGVQVASNLAEVDAALTARLKTIVAAEGWPTIALVGFEASNAATLLLTHTADHAWQAELLPQLAALADQGKIDGSALALVIDKQLIAAGKPQRYGTQFKLVDGEARMYTVEDPGGLDSLRTRTLLPPIEAYKQQLAAIYHLKVGSRMVSPTPPAAAAAR